MKVPVKDVTVGTRVLINPSKLLKEPRFYPVLKIENIADGKGIRLHTPSLTGDGTIESDFPPDFPIVVDRDK